MKKQGFTLIELIFVIVIIGIVSGVAFNRFDSGNKLKLATEQVVRHINYTKHLAMIDDKFTPVPDDRDSDGDSDLSDKVKGSRFWYKKHWQIFFHTDNGQQIYSLFSDSPTDNSANSEYNGMPGATELALDPHTQLRLTGDDGITDYSGELNIEKEFSIIDVSFSGGCSSTRQKIMFDYLGRPYNGANTGTNSTTTTGNPYEDMYKIDSGCLITLTHQNEGSSYICVEPVTGYVREVNSATDCN